MVITILQRGGHRIFFGGGVFPIYYNITWGGVSRDPKFVLRNIWTALTTPGSVLIRTKYDERKLAFNATWIKGKIELSFILNVLSSMKAVNE